MKHAAQGLALPMVLLLLLISSLALMADWRSTTLAQGLGQAASQRWALQLHTHAALLLAVQDIQGPLSDPRHQPGSSKASQVFFPNSSKAWTTLQSRLGVNDCMAGICKPLGEDTSGFAPWLARLPQAQTQAVSANTSVHYWVEVLPLQSKLATTASPFVYRITALAVARSPSAVAATQALWHPTPTQANSLAVPMPLAGFKRILPLSP